MEAGGNGCDGRCSTVPLSHLDGFGLWVHRRRGILRRRAAPQRRGLNHDDPSQNQRREASTDHIGERPDYAGNKENGNKAI